MGFTALHILWLVPAFTLTTQDLVEVSVSPKITAECGKQVTLQCKVSSSTNGLSIKHIEWSRSKTSLCSVNSDGKITPNRSLLNDFYCEYKEGQLSLIFQKAQPLESGDSEHYRCKLRSNKGTAHGYTSVELQECCQIVKGVSTSRGPVCTFEKVYPDGDVHWFHGSHNLSDGSIKYNTSKSVDEEGWLTIHSHLEWKTSDVPYNCSLKSSKSGRYIASTLVKNDIPDSDKIGEYESVYSRTNGLKSQVPMRTFLFISILLVVTSE